MTYAVVVYVMRLHYIKMSESDKDKSDVVGAAFVYIITVVILFVFIISSFGLDTTLMILRRKYIFNNEEKNCIFFDDGYRNFNDV